MTSYMIPMRALIVLLLSLCSFSSIAQMARIYGIVSNEKGEALEGATVAVVGTEWGTITNQEGKYSLPLPEGKGYTLAISALGHSVYKRTFSLRAGELRELSARLEEQGFQMEEVVKKDDRARYEIGSIFIDPSKANQMPSTIGGIEGIIKTFVGSNNELTSQYSVRGGNYDENLVYVNDFEIQRPFLVSSGQQEGLSFINSDLTGSVNFSLGGFAARYGDKMSSVLDITYKRPKKFGGSAMLSLLGGSMHLEGASKNNKWSYLFGLRQKSNQYLLQAQPTKGVYNPTFTDVQALINFKPSKKWEVEVLGNYARNRFTYVPEQSISTFGLINKAFQLETFFTGGEVDRFDSRFGGISTTYAPSEKLRLKLLASAFQSDERETYDIGGEYLLAELETDLGKKEFGQVKYNLGTGFIQTHARNYLNVTMAQLGHRGSYDMGNHYLYWGVDAQQVGIEDELNEWERRDSAGFTQPYNPDAIIMRRWYNSSQSFTYHRLSAYVQDNFRFNDSLNLTLSAGVRFNYSFLNNEFIVSPRLQLAYQPKWKNDIVFKLSGGMYAQPPLYREMRDLNGKVNTQVKAQKSLHFAAGTDYNFMVGNKPFKFTAEAYYKNLWDLIPYEYDNVRIRYFGDNSAVGYAYGGEIRLYGDLVKDAPSWISLGIMNTKEDILNDSYTYKTVSGADSTTVSPGFVPRPSDRRLMASMFFQDYLPSNKNFRVHLNLMYSTGLPFGPPDQQRFGDTLRIPDYKRVDIGFSALLLDAQRKVRPAQSFFNQLNSIWLSAEVFNLLGMRNTLSYSWIQDQTTSRVYAVPNRLTARLLNVKLIVEF